MLWIICDVLRDNLKNVKYTHGGVLLLVKLQASKACTFTRSNTPPWVVFTFFKLLPDRSMHHILMTYEKKAQMP